MKKFVVFDLDGTLIDTLLGITSAVNKTLDYFNFGFHYDYDEVKKMIGNGARKLFLRFTKNKNFTEELEGIYQKFLEFYEQEQYISKPYEGVISTLKELNDKGIDLIIYSNKPDPLLQNLVKVVLKDIKFLKVQGQDESYPVKPDVTLLNKILKENNLSPIYGLYVGDSLTDMQTSINAQMDFIFLDYGYSKEEDKCKIFGTIVTNFSEILGYIK